jgi:hypothetical protein
VGAEGLNLSSVEYFQMITCMMWYVNLDVETLCKECHISYFSLQSSRNVHKPCTTAMRLNRPEVASVDDNYQKESSGICLFIYSFIHLWFV